MFSKLEFQSTYLKLSSFQITQLLMNRNNAIIHIHSIHMIFLVPTEFWQLLKQSCRQGERNTQTFTAYPITILNVAHSNIPTLLYSPWEKN